MTDITTRVTLKYNAARSSATVHYGIGKSLKLSGVTRAQAEAFVAKHTDRLTRGETLHFTR